VEIITFNDRVKLRLQVFDVRRFQVLDDVTVLFLQVIDGSVEERLVPAWQARQMVK
jgi:hypothetical protein